MDFSVCNTQKGKSEETPMQKPLSKTPIKNTPSKNTFASGGRVLVFIAYTLIFRLYYKF